MYRLYSDIRDVLGEPLWHDEQGVPRYVPYAPQHGGIYDQWSALLEIQCQACGRPFLVSSSFSLSDMFRHLRPDEPIPQHPVFPTADNCGGDFAFGDAPWHDGDRQCSGTTMTTDTVRVVEFWTHDGGPHGFDWQRRPEYEFSYPVDESEWVDAVDPHAGGSNV
jgi:hypothetical protein